MSRFFMTKRERKLRRCWTRRLFPKIVHFPVKETRYRGRGVEGRREQIKHAAEKRRGSEMSYQWTGEVGVETFCSYKLSFSSEMRERPRKWKNSDIMTDFIMHVDKLRCTPGSVKLLWYEVISLMRPAELKPVMWNKNHKKELYEDSAKNDKNSFSRTAQTSQFQSINQNCVRVQTAS